MRIGKEISGLALLILLSGAGGVLGQESAPVLRRETGPGMAERLDQYVEFQTSLPARIFGVHVRFRGVLPMAVRVRQPLQLINPFAPPEYGDGYRLLIVDPIRGTQEGITVIGFRF